MSMKNFVSMVMGKVFYLKLKKVAKEKKCNFRKLETSSFQALDFYRSKVMRYLELFKMPGDIRTII